MKNYKQRLALSIVHYTTNKTLTPEHQGMMIDLEAEYKLIQEKKSELSRMQRDEVEYVWESILQSRLDKEKDEIDNND